MTTKEELALGETAFQQVIQRGGGRFADPALVSYVETLGQNLIQQSRRPDLPFRFAVVNDSVANVFALPGGYVVMTRGLLLKLSNQAELLAVLGHEIGHMSAGHCLHGLKRKDLYSPVDVGASLTTNPFFAGAARLIATSYSLDEESEADRLGIDCLVKAGYTPLGLLQLQGYFSQEFEKGAIPPELNSLFLRHPFSEQRLTENRDYLQRLPAEPEGNDSEFARGMEQLWATRQGYVDFDRAQQLEQQGAISEAILLYHQALLEAPDEPLILTSLGLAYLRSEDLIPARRYLIKAVRFQADYYQSHLALGYVYQQKQQYDHALEQFEAGFKLLPTLEGGYLLARARQQLGDTAGARQLYGVVTKVDAQGKLGHKAADMLKQMEK